MAHEVQFTIFLYDEPIGHLVRRGDSTRVVLREEYIGNVNRAVLGLQFEENLRKTWGTRQRLPAWFSNLLPEGTLREWISLDRGVSVHQESELLVRLGSDLPGAVRVLVSEVDGSSLTWDEAPDTPRLSEPPTRWRFSLAGVALKFSMLGGAARFTAPAVGERGDWIVKTPDGRHPGVPQNEFAMMTLAGLSGIEVPEVRLLPRDMLPDLPEDVWGRESVAYAVKRFDRGPHRELIHIEDFAQVRGKYPEEKYFGTFETLAALIYRGRDIESLREFARRLAFNCIIGNGDAHLKNWSLIYRDRRRPVLSPAYDLVSTFTYVGEGHTEDLGLKFRGKKGFDSVGPKTLEKLEKRLGAQADLADVSRELAKSTLHHVEAIEGSLAAAGEDRATEIVQRIRTRAGMF